MALLVIGSVAATAGAAAYIAKKKTSRYVFLSRKPVILSRSRYFDFTGEEDPRLDPDLYERDPDQVKSLTKFYSVDYPEILVGWKIRTANGRSGTIVNCKRRFCRATRYEVLFTDKALQETMILNRKNNPNKRKYIDFDLISREF